MSEILSSSGVAADLRPAVGGESARSLAEIAMQNTASIQYAINKSGISRIVVPGVYPVNNSFTEAAVSDSILELGVGSYLSVAGVATIPSTLKAAVPIINQNSKSLNLVSGRWLPAPSIYRVLFNGTGSVQIDAKDFDGTITTGVASFTLSGAVDQVEYPYLGDKAVAIRATFPTTLYVEVL